MATKMQKIESKEFKIWEGLFKRTTAKEVAESLKEKGTPLSWQTVGNIMRTQYATYKSYVIMAEYFGTKPVEIEA